MPRVLVEPLARAAHAVARIRSNRDSATPAAIVRDWVLVRVVRITDAVPARASRPTLKITTATRSSTIVKPRSERGDVGTNTPGVMGSPSGDPPEARHAGGGGAGSE